MMGQWIRALKIWLLIFWPNHCLFLYFADYEMFFLVILPSMNYLHQSFRQVNIVILMRGCVHMTLQPKLLDNSTCLKIVLTLTIFTVSFLVCSFIRLLFYNHSSDISLFVGSPRFAQASTRDTKQLRIHFLRGLDRGRDYSTVSP